MADNAGGIRIGFSGLLGLLFIGLKLGGVINWSWWFVLAPLWVPAAIGVTVLLAVLAIAILAALLSK